MCLQMPTKIWGISDNRAGHLAQVQAVLQLLPFKNSLFILQNSLWGKFNYSTFPLGVRKKDIIAFKERLKQETPEVLLVIGRRNLSIALYLKRIIRKVNANIKLIFLMPPGINSHKDIDYIFMHRYKMSKKVNYHSNVIPLDFSPAKLVSNTSTLINSDIDKKNLSNRDLVKVLQKNNLKLHNIKINKPYIGVIIGGAAKGVCWNIKVASVLCNYLNNLAIKNNASLFITTSRRTGDKISYFIQNQLKGNFFWQFNPNDKYNPYLDIITTSDILVVTAETTSMIADCITLNPIAKVLLFDDIRFKGKRFKPFRNFLYNNNYAASLKDGNLSLKELLPQNKSKNSAYFIANFITNLIN